MMINKVQKTSQIMHICQQNPYYKDCAKKKLPAQLMQNSTHQCNNNESYHLCGV